MNCWCFVGCEKFLIIFILKEIIVVVSVEEVFEIIFDVFELVFVPFGEHVVDCVVLVVFDKMDFCIFVLLQLMMVWY